MGLADRLKDVAKKAEEQASEHKDQLHQAVQKAGAAADQRTGGKYSDRIEDLTARAGTVVDRVAGEQQHAPAAEPAEGSAAEPPQ